MILAVNTAASIFFKVYYAKKLICVICSDACWFYRKGCHNMLEVRDVDNRKVCEIEEYTGMIYVGYRKQMNKVELSMGKPYTIERNGVRTVITRTVGNHYKIDRYSA